jgi:sporulation protein YlmC with PRC-barrel domain
MTHQTRTGIGLVRLGDSDFVSANPEDDLRGKAVYDAEGQRIGGVEDLYIDPQEREVRFLEVGAGGFLGIGQKPFLVPVEDVTQVAEGRVAIEPGRTEKMAGPAPFDTKVAPHPPPTPGTTTTPRLRSATPRKPPTNDATSTPRCRTVAGRTSMAMVFMKSVCSEADRHGACDGGSFNAAWGVTEIMVKDILPDQPEERRKRSRLCALRAMDRLGLLGEENLIPTLARRPDLRWLADEGGARWAVLTKLGRIGESGAFEEAVEWALENQPSLEEATAYIRRFRLRRYRPAGYSGVGRRPVAKAGAAER